MIDTLALARRRHPGAANSLDALCQRYGIDSTRRSKHGALLDAEILAEVYAELMGGRQTSLALDPAAMERALTPTGAQRGRDTVLAPLLTMVEAAEHADFIATMGKKALWRHYLPRLQTESDPAA